MKLTDLKNTLKQNPEQSLKLVLPSGKIVPAHFHITEVGYIQKTVIDCGGKQRTDEHCSLQVWVANDTEHRVNADKLSSIIDHCEKILPSDEIEVLIEYENTVTSQYPISSYTIDNGTLSFTLGVTHTDCLAKGDCGSNSEKSPCCSDSDCCG